MSHANRSVSPRCERRKAARDKPVASDTRVGAKRTKKLDQERLDEDEQWGMNGVLP